MGKNSIGGRSLMKRVALNKFKRNAPFQRAIEAIVGTSTVKNKLTKFRDLFSLQCWGFKLRAILSSRYSPCVCAYVRTYFILTYFYFYFLSLFFGSFLEKYIQSV